MVVDVCTWQHSLRTNVLASPGPWPKPLRYDGHTAQPTRSAQSPFQQPTLAPVGHQQQQQHGSPAAATTTTPTPPPAWCRVSRVGPHWRPASLRHTTHTRLLPGLPLLGHHTSSSSTIKRLEPTSRPTSRRHRDSDSTSAAPVHLASRSQEKHRTAGCPAAVSGLGPCCDAAV